MPIFVPILLLGPGHLTNRMLSLDKVEQWPEEARLTIPIITLTMIGLTLTISWQLSAGDRSTYENGE
jgi:hypothetical protein